MKYFTRQFYCVILVVCTLAMPALAGTFMPQDDRGAAIPALKLKADGAHAISAGVASARNSVAFGTATRIVSVYATVPVYLRFGSSSVTAAATDHYFPAGIYYDFAIGGDGNAHATHIAVLRAASDGSVYISEKE